MRLSFQNDFDLIRRRYPALAGFRDPGALIGALRTQNHTHEQKNQILRDLVLSAQADRHRSQTAATMLLLALWPGLDAIHVRLWRHFRDRPEDLVSEVSGRLAIGIATLDLTRVTQIAATLLRNVERDVRRELTRTWGRARHEIEQPNEPTDPMQNDTEFRMVAAERRLLGQQAGAMLGADAGLVMAVAVERMSQTEAARTIGVAPEAGRKRYQRALARVRSRIDEDFS